MVCDLHCHTKFSDGALGIDDLVIYAKRSGMDFIGLTDHDTMAGVSRAEQLGKRHGIGIIGGAEMSTMDFSRNRKVHLLCYLPKRPDRLEGIFRRLTESRGKAMLESLRKVMRLFPLTEEHALRYAKSSTSLFSVHVMQALVDLGYTDWVYGSLYYELFGSKGSCVVPHEYPDVWETAELIKSAGGVCVLAHPSEHNSLELMREMAEKKAIDGIERYHPQVKTEDIPAIEAAIADFGRIATGGTDFHGGNAAQPQPLGTCLTPKDSMEKIFKLSKARE